MCSICGTLIFASNEIIVKKEKKDKKETATVNIHCISCGTINKENLKYEFLYQKKMFKFIDN